MQRNYQWLLVNNPLQYTVLHVRRLIFWTTLIHQGLIKVEDVQTMVASILMPCITIYVWVLKITIPMFHLSEKGSFICDLVITSPLNTCVTCIK